MHNYSKNDIRYLIYKRDNFRCSDCNRIIKPIVKNKNKLRKMGTVHPIIPINSGGAYMPHNLLTMCYECNPNKVGWIKYLNWCKSTRKYKKKLGRLGTFKKRRLIRIYGINCYLCNVETTVPTTKKLKPTDRTIDHFIPKSKNGTNDIDNLRVCCYKCNQEKGNRYVKSRRR